MTRILTIQDISCVGQCSLTVALPIISACGVETAILPSAVLSTHTAGFSGYTFRDLTDDMPSINQHWSKEGITFDAIYTGYLGSTKQIDYVLDIMNTTLKTGGKKIVDPAMADNGSLYPGFDQTFVESMKKLCACADIILPNITEASLLTGLEYKEVYDEAYIQSLLEELKNLGCKNIVLTGVSYEPSTTGVIVCDENGIQYYKHKKFEKGCHGTGDVYASSFVGAYLEGKSMFEAATIAANYCVECIENTQGDKDHWYGVKFEPVLYKLVQAIHN
ncbi:MAG: pyridoxamine kinase [Firmicutes bacterium]|nr:pyridoxamine kinase [Bacillota bacterium]